MPSPSSIRIALVCDFFYPRLGGVEMHIWSLAQHLIRQGHKVIVITHAYSYKREGQTTHHRKGVRYLPGPLKVYYCPTLVMTDEDTLPTFTATLPLMRWIWIREGINVVHAHQATSTMANESLVYAAALGIPTVYTDHSLFGFDDVAGVILNRVLQITLAHVCAIVCVSFTCRDNLILRAQIKDTTKVHVIPNAVDPSKFTPSLDRPFKESDRIKVVVVSRLVYRKGVDLLVGIIPIICKEFDSVDFILGGDGPKRLALQEMVEREGLQERVEFLGAVPHANVPNVLRRGHIFLNCSLTESFCIALLEAASCGLTVVSTNVGGVPEVLPSPEMVLLAEPNVLALAKQLRLAIERMQSQSDESVGMLDPWEMHQRVSTMYSWNRVARETVGVYESILSQQQQQSLLERLNRYLELGGMTGWVTGLLAMTLECWICFVEWWQPKELIDVVPDIPYFEPSND